MSRGSSLPTPSSFPAFPFEPYQIQLGFMQELYKCLEDGCVGLLESPTGTGKTISIICSSLQWLLDDRKRQEHDELDEKEREKEEKAKASTTAVSDDDLPGWLLQAEATNQLSEVSKRKAGSDSDKSAIARSRFKSRVNEVGYSSRFRPKPKLNTLGGSTLRKSGSKRDARKEDEVDEYALSDKENSEGEGGLGGKRRAKRHDDSSEEEEEEEEGEGGKGPTIDRTSEPKPYKTQILFCSRTHSQLSQFVGELKRTTLPDHISIVALAGRKVLCINEELIKAGPSSLINERCLEMQQSKTSSNKKQSQGLSGAKGRPKPSTASKCPYLQPMNQSKGSQVSEAWEGFVDHALGQPLDVEDLLALGESKGVCPYYGSRKMVEEADLIALPYSSLLSEEARESLGISLEGNIVIFDESHNLVDAVNQCHSFSIDLSQLRGAARQVRSYFERFSQRLGPANAQRVQLLLRVLETLAKHLSTPSTGQAAPISVPDEGSGLNGRVVTANDFLFDLSLDSINLVGLLGWVKEAKLLQKCAGYAQTQEVTTDPPAQSREAGSRAERLSSLHASTSFISALTNPDADGRVVVLKHSPSPSHPGGGGELKYLLLNAAAHFSRVLLKARSVILASGTLSPIQGLLQQLFPSHHLVHASSTNDPLFPSSISSLQIARHYECQHVIPNDNLIAMVVGKGPSGLPLSLRHSERSKLDVMDEVGRLLVNLCNIVPHGLIAFLPSFSQMDALIDRWKTTGAFSQLAVKKKIFVEPRSASEIDAVLSDYATTIKECKPMNLSGALLLSVVGAKLSEGINFGDELGRCVVVVGMPYPNPSDPELKERMAYIDKESRKQSGPHVYSSQQYYEDLCMKAVNQSIGRVIRHKDDHAAVILVDQRYLGGGGGGGGGGASHRPLDKLPKWMRPSLVDQSLEFGQVIGKLHKFFKAKQTHLSN